MNRIKLKYLYRSEIKIYTDGVHCFTDSAMDDCLVFSFEKKNKEYFLCLSITSTKGLHDYYKQRVKSGNYYAKKITNIHVIVNVFTKDWERISTPNACIVFRPVEYYAKLINKIHRHKKTKEDTFYPLYNGIISYLDVHWNSILRENDDGRRSK